MNTKLYLLILFPFLTFLFSCVDNSDQIGGGGGGTIPDVQLELNEENILGTWEVYFTTKSMNAPALDINAKYRFPDEDGFSVTFEKDGVYYEKNVFDMYTIKGKYEFVKNAEGTKNDSIRFYYNSKYTGDDTISSAAIPYLYDNRFVYISRYHGSFQGYVYNLEDMKYYRNLEKAPNYYPEDNPAFKKKIINEDDLLGTWYLFKSETRIDGDSFEDLQEEYGSLTIFSKVGDKRIYEFYKRGKELTKRGEYRVVDDVIHMYSIVQGTDKVEPDTLSFMYWVRDWNVTGSGTEIMTEGFEGRNKDNVLQELQQTSYHRKIK